MPGRTRALPKIETAGRISESRSAASTNSEIIPHRCQDSRAFWDVARSGIVTERRLGMFFRRSNIFESPVKTLLLVDGSSYLYRAYHALPDLRTAKGEPTGAIRGFVGMLKVLREQVSADYLACVFDARGRTFRDDIYAEYKANRTALPDDRELQIGPIHDVGGAPGWPILEIEGIEADDVIGILARQAQERGMRTVVSTGDKDLAQLVTEHVTLVNTMSNETLDVAGVREKFGVDPNRIVDYLTLVGDSIDNVPGVEKVGPKTAAKWLQQYDSLDGVIAAAPEIGGKIGENLRNALPWLPTAKTLV